MTGRSGLDYLKSTVDGGAEIRAARENVARLDKAPLSELQGLHQAYVEELVEDNKFVKNVQDARANLPSFGWFPPPSEKRAELEPRIGHLYFQPEEVLHPSASAPFDRLLDPRASHSAKLQRLLNGNEHVRRAFSQVVGGDVVPDHRTDGTISVIDHSTSAGGDVSCSTQALTGGSPDQPDGTHPETMYDLFHQLDQQVLDEAVEVYKKQNAANLGMGFMGLAGPLSSSPVGGVVSALQSVYGPDDSVGSVDVAVFRLDTDRLEQMYQLYRQITTKHGSSANEAIGHLRA